MRRATKDAFGHKYATEISIRALLAEGDFETSSSTVPRPEFQSAPSLRRATHIIYVPQPNGDISIRALLAEGDVSLSKVPETSEISIRALLAEGDLECGHIFEDGEISIRALLAEGDSVTFPRFSLHANFNPRPPCGGRREYGEVKI